jgi:2-polyprenyl-6-methoxyphenol hydroxylase-like FAD-dependent oxidoreductase
MTYDVVIAGAGPVGLFLACELRLAKLSVLVLELAQAASSPLKALPFGRRGLSATTTDALYRRGLLEAVVLPPPAKAAFGGSGASAGEEPAAQGRRPGGHFAGIPIPTDKIDASRSSYRLSTPAAVTMQTTMERIETVLAERADALGVKIKRGFAVEDFQDSGDAVDIRAGGKTFQGRWLVGCDGGRSSVRKIGGFDFVGTDPEFTGYSVKVEIADPDKLALGRTYTPTGMYFQSQPGVIAMVEFDAGAFHRSQPLTLDHVQAVLRRVSGADITLNALQIATTWTDRAYQATAYRKGRVLLAGDAAHIHSPLGGQGLNLGLGDAMNLGWKLAATVKGVAPDGLLDTYFEERHPEGARVLDWSRAQVALMRPSQSSRALEAIIRDLIDTRDGATYFAEHIGGVTARYDLGAAHPLVGRNAPNFDLATGTKLGELLKAGKGVLLDFDAHAPLQAVAARWADQIVYAPSVSPKTVWA